MNTGSSDVRPELTWFGQPRGLTILFLTEMWEIFSYYGMRALLIYYMTQQLLIGQQKASLIYGAYTASAYFTPIIGGIIADRWLGKQRAVVIGATVMALGHFMMASPVLLYAALATIALGNGLFFPTLPSQINDLYGPHDPRRGRAYNIYYVGINLGGFLAPLVCGTLGELYGWDWGFAAAGIGMLLGLSIYLGGRKYLPQRSETGGPRVLSSRASTPALPPRYLLVVLVSIVAIVTVFRGAYEQMGNTIPLWAQSGIDRRLGSFSIPMTWFQSLDPLLVFLMTPALLAWWRRRETHSCEPSAIRKMVWGALIVSGAYLLLAVICAVYGPHQASWIWLVLFFVIFTLGELHILPTGLGLFARLAPARFAATTIAAWFTTIFTGSLLAGAVGTLWSVLTRAEFFCLLAGLGVVSAAGLRAMERATDRVEEEHVAQGMISAMSTSH